MGQPLPSIPPSGGTSDDRLDSWKEIAAYLKRDVTTVQRWEKREGMPVHRHVHDRRGSVYALISELDAWVQSRGASLAEDREAASVIPADTHDDAKRSRMTGTHLWFALAGIAVLGLLAAIYFPTRGRAGHAARPAIRSLAVLPLKNLSGDPMQDYLADGMTEALIGRLSGIRDLRVTSHTSVMRFKDARLSVPEIAKALRVDAIVEGSVTREGNRIRVTAQLIRGATDEHFWSETYDRDLQDVLALESDLAQSIAAKVEVTITGEEHERLTRARPVSPEVYESYLQGLYELNKSPSKEAIESGVHYFEEAVNRDPTFALAYVGLSEAYSELDSNFVGEPPEPARQKAMSAARKALDLDSSLIEAHIVLGELLQEQSHWGEAETEYRRALELNPNDADAHAAFARWFLWEGRTDEALDWARRARELDPLVLGGTDMGWMLVEARRYDEAMHELRSVLAVQPDDAEALWDLGILLIDKNQAKDAIPLLEKAVSVSNRSPGVIGTLIRA